MSDPRWTRALRLVLLSSRRRLLSETDIYSSWQCVHVLQLRTTARRLRIGAGLRMPGRSFQRELAKCAGSCARSSKIGQECDIYGALPPSITGEITCGLYASQEEGLAWYRRGYMAAVLVTTSGSSPCPSVCQMRRCEGVRQGHQKHGNSR